MDGAKKAGEFRAKAEDEVKKAEGKMSKAKSKMGEETVSDQVSALLEAEGLSEEFKLQAVTIFEAAVKDQVLQIEEGLKKEFDEQLQEAIDSLNKEVDEFLSEAVAQWHKENEVAIKANFNIEVQESFIDGLRSLIAEHNIEVPTGKEDALTVALGEVDKLNESVKAETAKQETLQEQINTLTAEKILESFKSKMTQMEFDRFKQLTESVKYVSEDQYEKQLTIVLENFGSSKKTVVVEEKKEELIVESTQEIVTTFPQVSAYANYLTGKRK